MAVLPTASESPLVYACELWVSAMCPALRGSTVSYAGVAHFPKHSLEYSLNFWSQSKKTKQIDALVADFIRASKGTGTTMNHHMLGTPPKEGGMGVRQLYPAYRRKYVTSMQQAMRAHPELFPFPLSAPIPHTQTPMLTYVALMQSMGVMLGVSLQPMRRRLGGPDLYDSEDTKDGRLLAA